jgi:exodeoxyribonuclease VII small subunit
MEKEEDFSIEDSIKRLEEIAKILENPATSLKDSMTTYTEGVNLIKACKDHLCDVEKEMIILTGENSDR